MEKDKNQNGIIKDTSTPHAKLSSKNFDKLMTQRGLTKKEISTLKASFDRSVNMEVRRAKKGEKFVVTHGEQKASGVFVSKESLGNTPEKRIDRGSLPHSNPAKYETVVKLDRDQNLIYGKIAPQPDFQKKDPKHIARNGGGTQVITDGGYKKGAIVNSDSKYPIPSESKSLTKSQSFKQSLDKSKKSESTGKGNAVAKKSSKTQTR